MAESSDAATSSGCFPPLHSHAIPTYHISSMALQAISERFGEPLVIFKHDSNDQRERVTLAGKFFKTRACASDKSVPSN